jgi:hypothetical protein
MFRSIQKRIRVSKSRQPRLFQKPILGFRVGMKNALETLEMPFCGLPAKGRKEVSEPENRRFRGFEKESKNNCWSHLF